jgi:hypothetical protein
MLSFTRTIKLKLLRISNEALLDIIHATVSIRVVILDNELAIILAHIVSLVLSI